MKKVGFVLIALGLALFFFVVYNFFLGRSQTLSPVPENKGVKVIFISPNK
jgi:hypothetical protein